MLFINWEMTMQNLRYALDHDGITHKGFAEHIGVSPQSLSRYLSCKDTPSAEILERMKSEISFTVVMFHKGR